MALGSDATFWVDATCIQCRAQDVLDNLDEYTEMVRTATSNSENMRHARMALGIPQSKRLLDEAVRVGVRKGLVELRGVMLSPHECGKDVERDFERKRCDKQSSTTSPCLRHSGHDGACALLGSMERIERVDYQLPDDKNS